MDWSIAAGLNALFVAGAEFGDVCREYPILFVRAGNDEQGRAVVAPIAALGLAQNENLYLDRQAMARHLHAGVAALVPLHGRARRRRAAQRAVDRLRLGRLVADRGPAAVRCRGRTDRAAEGDEQAARADGDRGAAHARAGPPADGQGPAARHALRRRAARWPEAQGRWLPDGRREAAGQAERRGHAADAPQRRHGADLRAPGVAGQHPQAGAVALRAPGAVVGARVRRPRPRRADATVRRRCGAARAPPHRRSAHRRSRSGRSRSGS